MSEQLPPPGGLPPTPPAPPNYSAAPGGAAVGEQALSQSDERLWAMLAQLGGIVIGWLAGLIVMLVFGKRSAFVNSQAKEALNFQITLILASIVGAILTLLIIGFSIIAGIANNKGEEYRYPFILRLVK
jgi:uncharacterized Tic20 family protein